MSQTRLGRINLARALVEIKPGMKEGVGIGTVTPSRGRVVAEAGPAFLGKLRVLARVVSGVKEFVGPMARRIALSQVIGQGAEPRGTGFRVAGDVPGFVEELANGLNRCGVER